MRGISIVAHKMDYLWPLGMAFFVRDRLFIIEGQNLEVWDLQDAPKGLIFVS